jgi:CrcB protein
VNPANPALSLTTALWVALGGALGSVARYAVSELMHRPVAPPPFPFATLAVNVTGALALGWVFGWAIGAAVTPPHRLFLTVGVLGGFTTFSAFAFDSLGLLQSGQYAKAVLYVSGSVVLSIGAAALGFAIGRP